MVRSVSRRMDVFPVADKSADIFSGLIRVRVVEF
jgi:hypothetical protein